MPKHVGGIEWESDRAAPLDSSYLHGESRITCAFKWSLTLVCLLSGVLGLTSLLWYVGIGNDRTWHVALRGGEVAIRIIEEPGTPGAFGPTGVHATPTPPFWRMPTVRLQGGVPAGAICTDLTMPLWMVFLTSFVTAAVFWRVHHLIFTRRSRHLRGHCIYCGYDLTGNVSGVCSECGAEVDAR